MILLENITDITVTWNDACYLALIASTFAILRYRVAMLENKLKEIVLKQDDFRKVIYSKLEENNQCMHNIELNIEKLRSELLIKIKK